MHIDSMWEEVFAACERIGATSVNEMMASRAIRRRRQGARLTVNDFGGFKNTLLKSLRSSQDIQENT
jgi:hypothetical protein